MIKTTLLADSTVQDVFGKITPAPGMGDLGSNPAVGLQNIMVTGIKLFILLAALALLLFLLWGALDWIISGGEKEKISKAQQKITNAIIGFILIFVALGIFGLVTGDILGIVQKTADGGWILNLPTLSTGPTN